MSVLSSLLAGGHAASFDLAYIDGSHRASEVVVDVSLAWRLLKRGGLMLLDDYKFESLAKADERENGVGGADWGSGGREFGEAAGGMGSGGGGGGGEGGGVGREHDGVGENGQCTAGQLGEGKCQPNQDLNGNRR